DARTAALGLKVHNDPGGFLTEAFEPSRVDRGWEARSRSDQAHVLRARPRFEGQRGQYKQRRAKQRRAGETLHATDPFWLRPQKHGRPADWRSQLPPGRRIGSAQSISCMTVT